MSDLKARSALAFLESLSEEVKEILFDVQLNELSHQQKESVFRRLRDELYGGEIIQPEPEYLIVEIEGLEDLQISEILNAILDKMDEYYYENTIIYFGSGDPEVEGNFEVYRPSAAQICNWKQTGLPIDDVDRDLRVHPDARNVYNAILRAKGKDVLDSSILVKMDHERCDLQVDDPSITDIIVDVMEDFGIIGRELFSDNDFTLVDAHNFQIPIDDNGFIDWKIVRHETYVMHESDSDLTDSELSELDSTDSD